MGHLLADSRGRGVAEMRMLKDDTADNFRIILAERNKIGEVIALMAGAVSACWRPIESGESGIRDMEFLPDMVLDFCDLAEERIRQLIREGKV